MRFAKSIPFALLIPAVALLVLAIAACGGGGEPQALEIAVAISNGKMTPETIRVKQGDMVTLKIIADTAGEFHLHTYDLEAEIPEEEETDFYFVANATGRFQIAYHPGAEEIELGFLEVQPR